MSEEITDRQWALLAPLLPVQRPLGRGRADDRQALNGILWWLRTGARWQDLPKAYGSDTRCHRRGGSVPLPSPLFGRDEGAVGKGVGPIWLPVAIKGGQEGPPELLPHPLGLPLLQAARGPS
jgi:transposase